MESENNIIQNKTKNLKDLTEKSLEYWEALQSQNKLLKNFYTAKTNL